MQLLVVDDSRTVLTWFRALVSPLGHEVRGASSGEEALEILSNWPADLVVTDLVMPGMGGASLLAEVRRRWPHLPVVVMSGLGSVTDAVDLLRSGADEFLAKPVRQDELLSCLDRVGSKARVYKQSRLFDELVDSMSGMRPTGDQEKGHLPAFAEARAAVMQRFERLYLERLLLASRDVATLAETAGISMDELVTLLERHELAQRTARGPVGVEQAEFLAPP